MFKPFDRVKVQLDMLLKGGNNKVNSVILKLIKKCGGCRILPTVSVKDDELLYNVYDIKEDKNYILIERTAIDDFTKTEYYLFPYNEEWGYAIGSYLFSSRGIIQYDLGKNVTVSAMYKGIRGGFCLFHSSISDERYTLIELPKFDMLEYLSGLCNVL